MSTAGTFSAAYEAARAGSENRRAIPADAFRAARRTWLAGQRLDMAALSTSLGISRPTLYKWCGDREQLLTEIVWSITEATFDQVMTESASLSGLSRILHVATRFTSLTAGSDALHAYVRNETHAAIRLLTTRGGFQDRFVAKIAAALSDEASRSQLTLKAEPELLAYAIVRVTEGFLYNDAIAAVEPRLEDAAHIIRLILD